MGRQAKPMTVRLFIKDTETGITHPWESLDEKQITEYRRRMTENAQRMLTDYYTAHPELFEKL